MFKSPFMGASLAAEMETGQFEIAIAQLAVAGVVIGMKKAVQKIHEKRERKRDAKEAAANARQQEIQDEIDRQREIERQAEEVENARIEEAKKAEEERLRQIQEAKSAEQQMYEEMYRIHDEETKRQEQLNQQRELENQQDIERAQGYAMRELDQMESEREQRLRNQAYALANDNTRIRYVQGYPGRSEAPWIANYLFPQSMLQSDRERDEEWWEMHESDYQVEDGPLPIPEFPDDDGNDDDDDDNQNRGHRPGGPSGPGGSGGSGGNPGGNPGGNGYPNNGNGQPPNYRRIGYRNPFADILMDMTRRIAEEKNSEKQDVENAYDEDKVQHEADKQQEDGENQQILGQDPATWSPTGRQDQYPGKNGGGIYNPGQSGDQYPGKNGGGIYNPQPIKKEDIRQSLLDNQHLTQQQIEAIVMAQGIQEQTAENQLTVLADIDQRLGRAGARASAIARNQQVKITPGSIYSMQIARF